MGTESVGGPGLFSKIGLEESGSGVHEVKISLPFGSGSKLSLLSDNIVYMK